MVPAAEQEQVEKLGVVEAGDQGDSRTYELTDLGVSLRTALKPLDNWATRWAAKLE